MDRSVEVHDELHHSQLIIYHARYQ